MPNVAVLQSCVNVVTTSTSYEDFVTLAAQIDAETSNIEFTVPSVSALPDLSTNVLPDGTVVFVDSLNNLVFSSLKSWISIGGNLVRNDGNATVLNTWGSNCFGQLGSNSTTDRSSPAVLDDYRNVWCQIDGGYCSSAAIKNEGTLWTWGWNNCGQLGDNTTINRSSPNTVVGGGTTWCQVSIRGHAAAVKTDGTLWLWGKNSNGQLGDNTVTNKSSPITTSGGGTDWKSVSVGIGGTFGFTAAIKTDLSLWAWGNNKYGQLGINSTTYLSSPRTTIGGGTTWCQVSAGFYNSAAVKTDGTLWTWGRNYQGVLGDNSKTNRSSPVTTSGGGTTWCQVSIYSQTAAIKSDGTLWTWGYNCRGSLGTNNLTSRSSPGTTIGGGTTWCQVSSSNSFVAAVKTDGTLWTWGINDSGQLGDNTVVSKISPITASGGIQTWRSVSAGTNFAMAIYFCNN